MLSGQHNPFSVLDHPILLFYISKHPYFTQSKVSAPRDEKQGDCIVLMVEWLMMIARSFFINESQDGHSSSTNAPDFQMNSLSPSTSTLHTTQSIPPTPSTCNCTIKPNLLSGIMDHFVEKICTICCCKDKAASAFKDLISDIKPSTKLQKT